MTEVELKNFSLRRGAFALKNVCFTVAPGEIFVILGETGSGKTILLEAIAGFYSGDSGAVFTNGTDVTHISPEQRHIGVVYQDYGLFPHMTVFENIAYGLTMRHINRAEVKRRVLEIADRFEILHLLKRMCGALSGGECQRTALARALVLEPELLLLDEPFSALDPLTRDNLYKELQDIHIHYGCTILLVTHSFDEAQLFGARIGVMIDGELKAVRNADELFLPYSDDTVNRFLGISLNNQFERILCNDRRNAI
ncbi:MAG: ATP-binding cassette domain-containing protein [Hydrogenoanaerobacterium sp.]